MLILFINCSDNNSDLPASLYYEVTLDRSSGQSHYEIGQTYGAAILNMVPDYEKIIDYFLRDITTADGYTTALNHMNNIRSTVPQKYRDEIDGIASVLCSTSFSIKGDGKLSQDELYLFNLHPDIIVAIACTALSVYSTRSSTYSTITGRVLDWFGGYQENYLSKIHSVVTIKNPEPEKSICNIGYLGFCGMVTGFNENSIFAAIMDSIVPAAVYSSTDKRSFTFDLRHALETFTTIDDAATYMKDASRIYTFNHLIYFSDNNTAKVLENDFLNTRAVRINSSTLHSGVTWGYDFSLAAVNSFLLFGNVNNHVMVSGNQERWDSLKNQLQFKSSDGSVSPEEIKEIMSYFSGSTPGLQSSGDIYNYNPAHCFGTQQIIIYQPIIHRLQIFFRPDTGGLPSTPEFHVIPVRF